MGDLRVPRVLPGGTTLDPEKPASPTPLVVDTGTGHMTLWGVPVWIIPPQYHAEMQAELEALSGKAGQGMLYRVAFRSGRRAVEALGLAPPAGASDAERTARLRRFEEITLAAGHGISTVTVGDLARRDVTMTMRYSLLASLHPPSREPVCHYYEGFLAGFVTAVLGAPVEGVETECHAKGDTRCLFRTKPVAASPV